MCEQTTRAENISKNDGQDRYMAGVKACAHLLHSIIVSCKVSGGIEHFLTDQGQADKIIEIVRKRHTYKPAKRGDIKLIFIGIFREEVLSWIGNL